jgi:Ca2+-binding RTX toxin-like protein
VTKALIYDADGVGGAAGIQFATINSLTGVLSAADFLVI